MTRFKQLVKKYSVYSLTTFPTGTKAAYRQTHTHTRTHARTRTHTHTHTHTNETEKGQRPKEDEKPIGVFCLSTPPRRFGFI